MHLARGMDVSMNPRIFLLSVALLGVPSCIIASASDDPPPPVVVEESSGLLTIQWSIAGDTNPAECGESDADALLVSVFSQSGAYIGEFEQYCQVFETGIQLEPGTYLAEAVLIAPDGIELTTPVDLPRFDIAGNDALELPIDFPASAFY